MQSLTLCCVNQRGDKKIIYLQRLESDSALHMLTSVESDSALHMLTSVESDSSLANTALTNVYAKPTTRVNQWPIGA